MRATFEGKRTRTSRRRGLQSGDAGVDDGVHAATVDERELAQVEHDQSRLGRVQRPLQLRRRRDVELAPYVHPGRVTTAVCARAGERRR
jgi:hypothetical protein